MSLVPGGAIERYIFENGMTALTSEEGTPEYAQAWTDRGLVVWTQADGLVRLLPTAPGVVPAARPQVQRTMFDAVNWQAIPASAEVVAGYVDGLYRWPDAAWQHFQKATRVRIAVLATTNDGDVLDVEPGNATPDLAPAWVKMRQAAGLARPVVYCPRSEWAAVQAACQGLDVDYWVADWTGSPHLIDGTVATQWADPAWGSGGDYDVSLCRESWPQ